MLIQRYTSRPSLHRNQKKTGWAFGRCTHAGCTSKHTQTGPGFKPGTPAHRLLPLINHGKIAALSRRPRKRQPRGSHAKVCDDFSGLPSPRRGYLEDPIRGHEKQGSKRGTAEMTTARSREVGLRR